MSWVEKHLNVAKAESAMARERQRFLNQLRREAREFRALAHSSAGIALDVVTSSDVVSLDRDQFWKTLDAWLLAFINDNTSEHSVNLFGAWIGEILIQQHGANWIFPTQDRDSWTIGFSRILFQAAPFKLARNLLSRRAGIGKILAKQLDKIGKIHSERVSEAVQTFSRQHYYRLSAMPLGQWMVINFDKLSHFWRV